MLVDFDLLVDLPVAIASVDLTLRSLSIIILNSNINEYSGTTTLSFELAKWGKKQFIESGKEEAGWDLNAFHDHWKIPHVNNFSSPKTLKEQNELIAEYPDASNGDWSRTGLTKEEQEMILGLTPRLKEMFQRYHLEYHIQKAFYKQNHHIMIGAHIEEGIY